MSKRDLIKEGIYQGSLLISQKSEKIFYVAFIEYPEGPISITDFENPHNTMWINRYGESHKGEQFLPEPLKVPKNTFTKQEVITLLFKLANDIDDSYRPDTRNNIRGYELISEGDWFKKNI